MSAMPKFEIYKDAAGKFRFRLKAPNGEIIASGEAYESKEACIRGIESVRENAPRATVDDTALTAWKKKPTPPLRRRKEER
jgi:uncharacterized protein YegP (UPF0339 family)